MHQSEPAIAPLEVWGGIECTVNRVGDRYFDQLEWSGHYDRPDDLDRIAELGIRTLRYPVLWETIAPDGLEKANWSWIDERMAQLQELGIRPIVTLVHHGSGPRSTHLLDEGFAPGLAVFAAAVAERYPWVQDYTPVNEPLTTARFSALYGHWYPHTHDTSSFVRALLNQVRATSLAMEAIRRINSTARLVQTEDIGKVHSTPLLQSQADFENERRWLSLDLLCGRLDHTHPFWRELRDSGTTKSDLDWFLRNATPPDIIGINYYLTSERYLDERLNEFPQWSHGGNHQYAYADVEAARVFQAGLVGLERILRDTAERYDIPLAVTEVHIWATRCDQLRWVDEACSAVNAVRHDGVDLQAMTIWALLGSFNWHRLVTSDEGHYESGAFDVSDGTIRPTALAGMIKDLTAGRVCDHPALSAPGWWRRAERSLYGEPPAEIVADSPTSGRVVVVVAKNRSLGAPLERRLLERHLPATQQVLPRDSKLSIVSEAGSAWATVVVEPSLSESAAEVLSDLASGPADMVVAVVTLTPPRSLPEKILVIEFQGRPRDTGVWSTSFPDELPNQFWDDVIDLLIDREQGRWIVASDGTLKRASRGIEPRNGRHSTVAYRAGHGVETDCGLDGGTHMG